MNRALVFVLGIASLILLLRYRRNVGDFIGPVSWAEQYLGSGGTYTLVTIIALVTFVVSTMYAFGTLQELLGGSVGMLFGG